MRKRGPSIFLIEHAIDLRAHLPQHAHGIGGRGSRQGGFLLGHHVVLLFACAGRPDGGPHRQAVAAGRSFVVSNTNYAPTACLRVTVSAAMMSAARDVSRTISTGHCAVRSTRSATLPSIKCANPPRPCVPITIRSLPRLFASPVMAAEGRPTRTCVVATTPAAAQAAATG